MPYNIFIVQDLFLFFVYKLGSTRICLQELGNYSDKMWYIKHMGESILLNKENNIIPSLLSLKCVLISKIIDRAR